MSGINHALRAAADQFGTPLYVYNTATITGQYNKLVKAFSSHKTRFFYACKALSNVAFCGTFTAWARDSTA